jgi:hypothetical protein
MPPIPRTRALTAPPPAQVIKQPVAVGVVRENPVEALLEEDRDRVRDDHGTQQPHDQLRGPARPHTLRRQLGGKHQVQSADDQHRAEDDQGPGVKVQTQHRLAKARVGRNQVQQDLPAGNPGPGHGSDDAQPVAGGEIRRGHLARSAFQQDEGRPQGAQYHGHALEHAQRAGQLALPELDPRSPQQHAADGQDIEVRHSVTQAVAHSRLSGFKSSAAGCSSHGAGTATGLRPGR